MTVNISLTPQQEARVRDRVQRGEYASVSEVVRSALRLLDQQDQLREIRLQELREEILVGVRQAREGLSGPFDEEMAGEIKRQGRKRRTDG